MKVAVIGSGGREHAICLALKNSNKINEIFCIPGNAGTNFIGKNLYNGDLRFSSTQKKCALQYRK